MIVNELWWVSQSTIKVPSDGEGGGAAWLGLLEDPEVRAALAVHAAVLGSDDPLWPSEPDDAFNAGAEDDEDDEDASSSSSTPNGGGGGGAVGSGGGGPSDDSTLALMDGAKPKHKAMAAQAKCAGGKRKASARESGEVSSDATSASHKAVTTKLKFPGTDALSVEEVKQRINDANNSPPTAHQLIDLVASTSFAKGAMEEHWIDYCEQSPISHIGMVASLPCISALPLAAGRTGSERLVFALLSQNARDESSMIVLNAMTRRFAEESGSGWFVGLQRVAQAAWPAAIIQHAASHDAKNANDHRVLCEAKSAQTSKSCAALTLLHRLFKPRGCEVNLARYLCNLLMQMLTVKLDSLTVEEQIRAVERFETYRGYHANGIASNLSRVKSALPMASQHSSRSLGRPTISFECSCTDKALVPLSGKVRAFFVWMSRFAGIGVETHVDTHVQRVLSRAALPQLLEGAARTRFYNGGTAAKAQVDEVPRYMADLDSEERLKITYLTQMVGLHSMVTSRLPLPST